jgi:protein involved in polysaccharide export with SLBB domain
LDVSLGKLHSIRITVAGYARFPGLEMVPANSTLMEALIVAGGPNKDGTLRDIVLSRANQKDVHVDLYGLLATGHAEADQVLLSGDQIFIGPIGPTAAVIGPVGSGIYELAGKTTLEELTHYAGRINAFTQLNVQVERSIDNARREVQAVDFKREASSFVVVDGDVIAFSQIYGQLNETVAITGAVVRGSAYPFKEGMRVSDLIRAAGGFLLDASLERALIVRPLGNRSSYDVMLGDKKGSTREEAIWVDLAGILAGNNAADTPLNRLDTLRIFTQNEAQSSATVKIIGGVRRPGTYKLTAGMTLGDLIHVAGGPTPDAFAGESTIVRRKRARGDMHMDVELIPFRLDDIQHHLNDYDFLLENQDQVVVKRVQSMQVSIRVGGRVQFPGTHVLPDGSRISDLIATAGGLLPDADLRAAVFTRRRIQAIQQARLDDLFTRMEQTFGEKRNEVIRDGRQNEGVAAHLAYLGLRQTTGNIERFQARGRLVINMKCANFMLSHDNMVLEEGDELYIPRRENVVMVMGEANYPNAFVWNESMTVSDYMNKAGGLMPDADRKQIYVVMSNGEVYSDANKNLFGGSVTAFRPGPGDTILIPKQAPKRGKLATASDIALLIRQIAETGLVAASIPQTVQPNHPANVNIGLGNSVQSPPDIINNQAPDLFYRDTKERGTGTDDR